MFLSSATKAEPIESSKQSSGYVLNLNERADLGPQLAAAPELLAALESAVLALDDSAIRGACGA